MNKNNISVSVIVPVYNVALFLADCLDSIVNQTLQNIEIIAINDGSTDKSAEILEQYAQKDKRIKVITQENKGLSAARNVGINEAQGEFISFVDSDDWIDPAFLEKLYQAATAQKADIACCGIYWYGPEGKVTWIYEYPETSIALTLKEKLDKFRIPVWNKIYNREKLIKNNLFFREGVRFEDTYFTMKTMESLGKGVWVTGVYYHYRYNLTAITKGDIDIKKKNEVLAARTYESYFLYSRKIKTPYEDIQQEKFAWHEKRKYRILGIKCITVLVGKERTIIYLFGLPVWILEKKLH